MIGTRYFEAYASKYLIKHLDFHSYAKEVCMIKKKMCNHFSYLCTYVENKGKRAGAGYRAEQN